MTDWLEDPTVLAVLFGFSVAVCVAGVVLTPIVVARLPADYFVRKRQAAEPHQPWLRSGLRVLKNVAGVVLIVAGVAMIVLPGQGVLTIVAGLSLLEFPGKRRLQRRLLRTRALRGVLNRIRKRAGRPPLQL